MADKGRRTRTRRGRATFGAKITAHANFFTWDTTMVVSHQEEIANSGMIALLDPFGVTRRGHGASGRLLIAYP